MTLERIESRLDRVEFHNRREGKMWATVEAALDTTEGFDPVLTDMVHRKYNPRYLIGIGFGRMLNEIALHGESLQKVICMDVSPQVVATGRLVRDLLVENKNPVDFIRMVQDKKALNTRAGKIKPEEGVGFAISAISRHFAEFRIKHALPLLKEKIDISQSGPDTGYFIRATLLQNYDLFRRLSLEGRLLIAEADVTNPDFLQSVREQLPYYDSSNVVVYISHALQSLPPELFVYEKLNPSEGKLLLKDAATYNIIGIHNGEPVKYRIDQKDGEWKRDIGLIKYGENAYIGVSAIGNTASNAEVVYMSRSQKLSDEENPQRLEDAKKSAVVFFRQLELYAGFGNEQH